MSKKDPDPNSASDADPFSAARVAALSKMPVELRVVLGRTTLALEEILDFEQGKIITLSKLVHEPQLEIYIENRNVGHGGAVSLGPEGKLGVRILDWSSAEAPTDGAGETGPEMQARSSSPPDMGPSNHAALDTQSAPTDRTNAEESFATPEAAPAAPPTSDVVDQVQSPLEAMPEPATRSPGDLAALSQAVASSGSDSAQPQPQAARDAEVSRAAAAPTDGPGETGPKRQARSSSPPGMGPSNHAALETQSAPTDRTNAEESFATTEAAPAAPAAPPASEVVDQVQSPSEAMPEPASRSPSDLAGLSQAVASSGPDSAQPHPQADRDAEVSHAAAAPTDDPDETGPERQARSLSPPGMGPSNHAALETQSAPTDRTNAEESFATTEAAPAAPPASDVVDQVQSPLEAMPEPASRSPSDLAGLSQAVASSGPDSAQPHPQADRDAEVSHAAAAPTDDPDETGPERQARSSSPPGMGPSNHAALDTQSAPTDRANAEESFATTEAAPAAPPASDVVDQVQSPSEAMAESATRSRTDVASGSDRAQPPPAAAPPIVASLAICANTAARIDTADPIGPTLRHLSAFVPLLGLVLRGEPASYTTMLGEPLDVPDLKAWVETFSSVWLNGVCVYLLRAVERGSNATPEPAAVRALLRDLQQSVLQPLAAEHGLEVLLFLEPVALDLERMKVLGTLPSGGRMVVGQRSCGLIARRRLVRPAGVLLG